MLELVDHSYDLVLAGLTRTQRNKLRPDRQPSCPMRWHAEMSTLRTHMLMRY
jgi:hypothetical protein